MKTIWICVLIIGISVFMIIVPSLILLGLEEDSSTVSVINSNSPESTLITSLSQKTWHTSTSFSGASDKNTDTFDIQGTKFKLIYSVEADNEYSLLTLSVYEEDYSFPVEMIMTDIGFDGKEETIVYEGPGNYYLDIGAANLDGWEVEIRDYY